MIIKLTLLSEDEGTFVDLPTMEPIVEVDEFTLAEMIDNGLEDVVVELTVDELGEDCVTDIVFLPALPDDADTVVGYCSVSTSFSDYDELVYRIE